MWDIPLNRSRDMERRVSIREANLGLSSYIKAVENGDEVVITKRGRPVARLVPERQGKRKLTAKQQAALRRMQELAKKGLDLGPNPWPGRDALYDRGK